MKLFIAALLVMLAVPCYATIITPPVLIDGNGNVCPQYWNGSAWVVDTGVINSNPATATGFDTSAGGSGQDTIDLGAVYNWIYVTANDSCYVSLSYGVNVGNGDFVPAGGTMVYNYQARYLYVCSESAMSYPKCIRVRGLK